MRLYVLLVLSVVVLVFAMVSLSERYYGICTSSGTYYDCVIYRGFAKVGEIVLYQNGTFRSEWGGVSARGVLKCVGNCTPGSLVAAAPRSVYVVGREAYWAPLYYVNYFAYALAAPMALYLYALLLAAGGSLERMYRALRASLAAGLAAASLAVPIVLLDQALGTAALAPGVANALWGWWALRRVRRWTRSILT
ncbi:MAG: hypothetical protein QXJ71_02185 [Pyrobaculum sp.]